LLPGNSKVHRTLAEVSPGSDSGSTQNTHQYKTQTNKPATTMLVKVTKLLHCQVNGLHWWQPACTGHWQYNQCKIYLHNTCHHTV